MTDKTFQKLLFLNAFTSGHCMITHIALAMAYSYMFSNSIFMFTIFTGLYLMSMGLGVLVVEHFTPQKDRLLKMLILNSLLGVIIANPGVIGTLLFNEWSRFLMRNGQIDLSIAVFTGGILLSILIGMISGAELPLFSKLVEAEHLKTSRPITNVLVSDYIGAFLGIILFTFILNPFVGLIKAVLMSQLITLVVINIIFFSLKLNDNKKENALLILSLNLYVTITLLFQNHIVNFIDAFSGF